MRAYTSRQAGTGDIRTNEGSVSIRQISWDVACGLDGTYRMGDVQHGLDKSQNHFQLFILYYRYSLELEIAAGLLKK